MPDVERPDDAMEADAYACKHINDNIDVPDDEALKAACKLSDEEKCKVEKAPERSLRFPGDV